MLRRYRVEPELALVCHVIHLRRRQTGTLSHAVVYRRLATGSSPDRYSSRSDPAIRGIQVSKRHVEEIVGGTANESRVLHLGGHFVVDDGLLILAHDVDTQFKVVLGLQLVWLRLPVLWRKARPVHKSPVRGFDIADPYFTVLVSPYFSVLPREYLAIEVTVDRRGKSLGVGLSANSQRVRIERDRYRFALESSIKRQEI